MPKTNLFLLQRNLFLGSLPQIFVKFVNSEVELVNKAAWPPSKVNLAMNIKSEDLLAEERPCIGKYLPPVTGALISLDNYVKNDL